MIDQESPGSAGEEAADPAGATVAPESGSADVLPACDSADSQSAVAAEPASTTGSEPGSATVPSEPGNTGVPPASDCQSAVAPEPGKATVPCEPASTTVSLEPESPSVPPASQSGQKSVSKTEFQLSSLWWVAASFLAPFFTLLVYLSVENALSWKLCLRSGLVGTTVAVIIFVLWKLDTKISGFRAPDVSTQLLVRVLGMMLWLVWVGATHVMLLANDEVYPPDLTYRPVPCLPCVFQERQPNSQHS